MEVRKLIQSYILIVLIHKTFSAPGAFLLFKQDGMWLKWRSCKDYHMLRVKPSSISKPSMFVPSSLLLYLSVSLYVCVRAWK